MSEGTRGTIEDEPKPGLITVTFYAQNAKAMEKLIKSKAREIAERVQYEKEDECK